MDILRDFAQYAGDPLVLVGVLASVVLLAARPLCRSWVQSRPDDGIGSGLSRLALRHGYLLGLVVIAAGAHLKYVELRDTTSRAASDTQTGPREVDFGFVELSRLEATAVPSYKHGGTMVLFAGDEIAYRVLADPPVPPIELLAGEQVHLLPGLEGKVRILGPTEEPLPASLRTRGPPADSLPGGAPPRIAVNIEVTGTR